MPLYEYQCDCGNRDELLCHMDDKPVVGCPCGKTMARIFSVPAIRTNSSFMAGHDYSALDRNPLLARRAMAKAKRQGVSTGSGNHYSTQLGQWYSSKDDVRNECERRGWGCEGAVEVKKAPAEESDGKYRPSPKLVESHLQNVIDNEHEGHISPKKRKQLRRELTTRLAGNQD